MINHVNHAGKPCCFDVSLPVSILVLPVALLLLAQSSRSVAVPAPTPTTGPGTAWIPSGGVLTIPRGLSSVFLFNASFMIVGGCLDDMCEVKSGTISRYDPLLEESLPTAVKEVPLFFTIPSNVKKLPPTFVRASFAGPYAVIPVATYVMKNNTGDTVVRPYLVGPCALYFTFQGNSSETLVKELYHGVWGFSLDLGDIVDFGTFPDDVPYRANASCQAYGTRIFIVGGIYIDTLEPVSTIDAFDTVTMTYYPNVDQHVEAVMNPAITVDNEMMYIIGGQRADNCSTESPYYLWSIEDRNRERRHHPRKINDTDEEINVEGNHDDPTQRRETILLHFCQSPRATAYYFPPAYWLNESKPLQRFLLPEVPEAIVKHSSGGTDSTQSISVAEVIRAYSFGGILVITSFTSVTSTLFLEQLSEGSPRLLAPQWDLQKVAGIHVRHPSLMMFPVPDVFMGIGLALFSFGGMMVNEGDHRVLSPPMTNQIFQRFVGLSMPAMRGTPIVEWPVLQLLNISLQPPLEGYLRLSENSACVGNAVGTIDEFVNVSESNSETVGFLPLFVADQVFVCFAFGPTTLDSNLTDVLFFTVINAFTPFAVSNVMPTNVPTTISSAPTPTSTLPSTSSPSTTKSSSHVAVIVMSTVIPIVLIAVVLFVGVRLWRRKRYDDYDPLNDVYDSEGSGSGGGGGGRKGLSDRLFQEDSKDRIIRQTTSDSRYKVLKRIGEGAFSSVYLVRPKRDAHKTYAMKFMICADDRERLEAIKECETINSVQGHPSIIRLYDMFMNYEFGLNRREELNLDENDQALLLTSSMHAIPIQRKSTSTPNGGAGGTAPNERTVLSPNNTYRGRSTMPNGLASPSPEDAPGPSSAVFPDTPNSLSVHTRYLCLVMEYHPSGDLCRYVLRRAHERQTSAFNNNDSLAKKSSTTSDEATPPSLRTSSTRHPLDGEGRGSVRHALSESQLLSIAYQIASVLQFLHAQRPPIVHRDLKPENILIRGDMPDAKDPFIPVVVTDFGLAFIQEEHRRSGRGGGTRPYISPESWKGQTTTASDVWSLGCVLYALATERLTSETVRVMFQDAKFPKFTHNILSDLIRTYRYSYEFAVFVASILEVDPKKRPTAERLVKMFDVNASGAAPQPIRRNTSEGATREDDMEGPAYISFKRDAFGPNGAAELVPFECTLSAGSGLPLSASSVVSNE